METLFAAIILILNMWFQYKVSYKKAGLGYQIP